MWKILRVIMGCLIISQAIIMNDVLFGIAGLIFNLMTIFNVGFCGTGTCNTQQSCKTSWGFSKKSQNNVTKNSFHDI